MGSNHDNPTSLTNPDAAQPGSGEFSVVILTLDEQINIEACIRSLEGIDDIHVLDSGSSDQTCEIARRMGASVSVNPFESFGSQRNWAIDNMPMKHDWVLHLDADERMTPELLAEIRSLVSGAPAEAGFYVPNKLMFMGRWLKRAGGYPSYQVRLFHRGRLRFTDYGHGQREQTDGELGYLEHPYLHDAFSKGLDDWIAKHNGYSSKESIQALEEKRAGLRFSDFFSRDGIVRRRALKRLAYRLPARASIRWWVIILLQGGFLEGRPARTYASLVVMYERMTSIKMKWEEYNQDRSDT